ncbi:MAG: methyltransferase domain-containing protein [Deltaproteobacteria bacterium]|nr:methyltransferase domain-containing protein [Deltaproteobacteria bacterium]
MGVHCVTVRPLPRWAPAERLLGPGFTELGEGAWEARLPAAAAADVATRLRGLGLAGEALSVEVRPRLPRPLVREARAEDARRRRDTTPGFTRPGARLDAEGRWSLTPEVLALAMGRLAAGRQVVDAGCGAGGNAIGFARAGSPVTAVELDPARLELARHNARLYGVADRIHFLLGDAQQLDLSGDILFLDPPWGVDYDRALTPLSALPLFAALRGLPFRALWLKAPPSLDTRALPSAEISPIFGRAPGDLRRIKFLLLRIPGSVT